MNEPNKLIPLNNAASYGGEYLTKYGVEFKGMNQIARWLHHTEQDLTPETGIFISKLATGGYLVESLCTY